MHIWIRELYAKRQARAARKQPGKGKRPADHKYLVSRIPPASVERDDDVTRRDHYVYLGTQALIPVSEEWPDHHACEDEWPSFEEGGASSCSQR